MTTIGNLPRTTFVSRHASIAGEVLLCADVPFVVQLREWENAGEPGEARREAGTRIYTAWLRDASELDLRGLKLHALPDRGLHRLEKLRRIEMDREQLPALNSLPLLPEQCLIYLDGCGKGRRELEALCAQGAREDPPRRAQNGSNASSLCKPPAPFTRRTVNAPAFELAPALREALSGSLYHPPQVMSPEPRPGDRAHERRLSSRLSHLSQRLLPSGMARRLLARTASLREAQATGPEGALRDATPKIWSLVELAERMPHTEPARLAGRLLDKRDCLSIALEWALRWQPEMVQMISERLLGVLPPETSTLTLLGISFERAELRDWSLGRNIPLPAHTVRELQEVEGILANDDRQNVHDQAVVLNSLRLLQAMRERTGAVPLAPDEARTKILSSLAPESVRKAHQARSGLNRVLRCTAPLPHLNLSPSDALAVVCTYVESTGDPALRLQLRNALANRLAEIAREEPCPEGMIDRLADVPSGIDFSMNIGVSLPELEQEVARMAARINEEFEREYGAHADQARASAVPAHGDVDPDLLASELKRDMLMHKAKTLLADIRGFSPDVVRRAVDKVFPPDAVI